MSLSNDNKSNDSTTDNEQTIPFIPIRNIDNHDEEQQQNLSSKTTNDNDKNNVYQRSIQKSRIQASTLEVALYMIVFFMAMIGHELAFEAVTTEFQNTVDGLALMITLFQFGFCLLLPTITSQGQALSNLPQTLQILWFPYVRLSIVIFGATALASQSLKYVNYPTKVVFKSAKLIPTMIVSTVLFRDKKYTHLNYLAALLLCLGAAGYAFDPSGNGSGEGGELDKNSSNSSFPGLILLSISILCDALVPNLQQQLMTRSNKGSTGTATTTSFCLSAHELMAHVNGIGFMLLFLYMILFKSVVLQDAIAACREFPRLLTYQCLIGLGLATAVLAYTKLIQTSGSVLAVTVATLRKVATVVLSYIVFPKPLTRIHMGSGVLVLCGLILNSTLAKQAQQQRKGQS